MKKEDKITLSEWNELTKEQKEELRNWAVKHGYELDTVPGNSGTFDPICDYAALLTYNQIIVFLQEHKVLTKSKRQDNSKQLWEQLIKQLKVNR